MIVQCHLSIIHFGLMLLDVLQLLMDGTGEKASEEGMELLRRELKKIKEELNTSEEGL